MAIKIILFFLCLGVTGSILAQQLERQVIASAGSNAGGSSFTLGEVLVSSGSLQIVAGFQQPPFLDAVLGLEDVSNQLSVYPNPTKSVLTVSGSFFDGNKTEVSLYAVDGKRIEIIPSRSQNEIKIDLVNQPSGYYYLTLFNNKTQTIAKYKVLKF